MEIQLLNDTVIIFGTAIFVLFMCHSLRIPTVVGLLFTGILVGPYGLGLVEAIHDVEIFAEFGIVLLLFTIGIEFSLERLFQIRKAVLVGGSLQVVLTSLVAMFISMQFNQPVGKAVFIGFLTALSSTAIVLKMIQERAEVDSPHGRSTLGILIFQDIIIVPMILVTPLLSGADGNLGELLLILTAKGIGIILLVIVSAKWVVPHLLYQITRTRRHELFLLSVVVICFGVAWMTSKAGLSLSLGAFLAGLIISESEYSHQALGNILPFRDVFTTFFFVSIGMMLDVATLFQHAGFIILILFIVLFSKCIITCLVAIVLGLPLRTGILVGMSLVQIGEFSFILSKVGVENNLLSQDIYQGFLAVTIISMAATPFIILIAPRLAEIILRIPLPQRLTAGVYQFSEKKSIERKNHLIIIGFGINGKNLACAANTAGIPYAIIEMNPDTVKSERAKGEPIIYGDASQESLLVNAGIKDSRIVVVAINDPSATRRITEVIRRLNPNVHLIVRTRYLQEMKPLSKLGADEVIPEEFETSMEIFTRVLTKYLIPRDEIEKLLAEVRSGGYEMLRSSSKPSATLSDLKLQLHDVDISSFRIEEQSPLIGKTLAQIELRKSYGVSVVAIQRNLQILSNPSADTLLQSNDVLFVLGSLENISEAINKLS